jgi:hypothetical protein
MKSFLVSLLSVMLIASNAHARVEAYMGMAGQVSAPTANYAGDDAGIGQGGATNGLGLVIQGGIRNQLGSVYVGYLHGSNPCTVTLDDEHRTVANAGGHWTLDRLLGGVRWNPFRPALPSFTPFLGGGFSLGKTKGSATVQSANQYGSFSFYETSTSDQSLGWFIEAGTRIRLSAIADLVAALQYHSFDANFHGDYFGTLYNQKMKVTFAALQIGLNYTL